MSSPGEPARVVEEVSPFVVTSHTPAVWLADGVRAADRLRAGAVATRRIADLLELAGPPTAPVVGYVPTQSARLPPTDPVALAAAPTGILRTPSSGEIGMTLARPDEAPAVVSRDRVAAQTSPPRPLPEWRDLLPSTIRPDLGPAALLPPGRQRALLGALCARPTPSGELDVDALVEHLARRQPPQRLPRLTRFTTRRGVQLLVDFGAGMRGFERDRDEVWKVVRGLAGADGLEELRFDGSPVGRAGAGPGPRPTWRPYRPPSWGRPVLVLSDLGTGARAPDRAALVDQWLAFAEAARTAGCAVTALVPAPLGQLAAPLCRALVPVTWDRPATVRDAVAAARRAAARTPGGGP